MRLYDFRGQLSVATCDGLRRGSAGNVIMKAAVIWEANQPITIEEVQIGKPGPREVRIRTAFAGVCHSDLHFAGRHLSVSDALRARA